MRTRVYLLNAALVAATSMGAQQLTTRFFENFDTVPHQMVNSHTLTGPVANWNDTAALWVSPNQSYHANVVVGDTLFTRTFAFSTQGARYVKLTFDHIAKFALMQQGQIQVSINNGLTWNKLGSAQYEGGSNFKTTTYFNEMSYSNAAQSIFWGGPNAVNPTNSWWAHEEFDLSDIAGKGPTGASNGFSQVLVRFALQYRYPILGLPRAGWFIDNIKVETGVDETYAPAIKWNYLNAQNPVGEIYVPNSVVRFKVKEPKRSNSGVSYAQVVVRSNGGPWTTMNATLVNSGCADSTEAWVSIPCAVGETIDYYVQAADCAIPNNTVRSPATAATYFTFWRATAPPAHCGTLNSTTVPFVVSQFPFAENFNSAGWVAGIGDGNSQGYRGMFPTANPPAGRNYSVDPVPFSLGYAWSVRRGRTGTLSTGPLAGLNGGNDHYLYTEASQSGTTTSFTTPCIKLVNINQPAVEFYYHKYGAQMGSLRVDIDTGFGFTPGQFVQGAAVIAGQTQTSYADAWNSFRINLQPYVGKFVRLRFVATKPSVSNPELGDMAIDQLLVYNRPAAELTAQAIIEPVQTSCGYSASTNLKVRLINRGYMAPSQVPMAVSITNTSTGSVALVRDTVSATWTTGDLAVVTLPGALNLNALATYELKAWTELAGDAITSNDTTPKVTLVHQAPLSLPFHESFDGPAWTPGSVVGGTPGVSSFTTNSPMNQDGAEMYAFYVGRDRTPNNQTGPRWSFGRRGNYVYAKGGASGSPGLNTNTDAVLETRCVDLSTATQPVVSFWYHMTGSGALSITVDIFNLTTQQWVPMSAFVVSSPQQSLSVDDWRYHLVQLNGYAGSTVKVRVRAKRVLGSAQSDIAIDELSIYDRPAADVAVTSISLPNSTVNLGSPAAIQCILKNTGSQLVTNVPVVVTLTNRCGTASPFVSTQTVPAIAVGGGYTITIPGAQIPYTPGDLEVSVRVALSTDGRPQNDTLRNWTVGVDALTIPFGPVTFDNCSANEFSFYAAPIGLEMWEMGQSTLGVPAASGTNAWHSRRTQLLGSGFEYLRVPPLMGLDTTVGAEFRFKHNFQLDSNEAGNLQYYTGTNLVTLGRVNNASINGYGSFYGTSYSSILSAPGWTGSTGGSYITSSIPLNIWAGNSSPIQIRFQVGPAGGSSFWAIDDIEVVVPPQFSLSILEMRALPAFGIPGDSAQLRVKVLNNGRRSVANMTLNVNGIPSLVNLSTPLQAGASRWVTLPSWVNLSLVGTQTFCATVALVNNRLDQIPVGDTACTEVLVQNPIPVSAAVPFCADFESSSWGTFEDIPGTEWVLGTPIQGSLTTAYNGTKAYSTNLGADYGMRARSYLVSPKFTLDTGTTYILSFAHNMQSEPAVDGGHVEYSFDDITWYPLGYTHVPGSTNWCTEPSVVALNGQSGWSRSMTGYQLSSLRLKPGESGVRFRWTFASSNAVSAPGWTVDQVCLEVDSSTAPVLNLLGQPPIYATGCP